MKVHDLKPAPGSRRPKRRVARGIGGKGGKTAGRGHKGQGARGTVPARFEGGQTPLHRRTPKAKGFKNPFRIEYHVSPETLRERGLVAKRGLVKVLARGELSKPLTVRAHGFSRAAIEAIQAAGGSVETLPLPWPTGRPPARGNALTNR